MSVLEEKIVNVKEIKWLYEKIKTALNVKVDKEDGKGLSTNDYTTADKNKLEDTSKDLDVTTKRLDNLIKLSQGKIFDYQTDETEAYSKAVPLGSQQYGSLDMVGGKSLVYNQLLKNEKASKTVSGVTITNNGDGSFTLNGTATASTRYELQESGFATILTHKYYISSHNSKMSSTWGYMIFTHLGSLRNAEYERVNAGTIVDVADALAFRVMNGTTYNNDIIKPICVDLTQMFGAGNEPTLEQCKQIFSAGYYPYNEGEIMNFGVNEVESVGANQSAMVVGGINSTTGAFNTDIKSRRSDYFDATNGVSYQLFENGNVTTKTLQSFICFYDANKNFIFRGVGSQRAKEIYTASQVPTGAVYAAITFYEHANNQLDIYQMNKSVQVMIKASGEAITEYIPYRKETFTIPQSILDLPNYGASAGDVYNYIDFERKVYVQNVGNITANMLSKIANYGDVTRIDVRTTAGYPMKVETKNVIIGIPGIDKITIGTSSTEGWNEHHFDPTIQIQLKTSKVSSDTTQGWIDYFTRNNIKIYYELETPIETDISDLIDNGLIFAEGGGTITFKNVKGDDYHIPVPNKETYMVKLADSI